MKIENLYKHVHYNIKFAHFNPNIGGALMNKNIYKDVIRLEKTWYQSFVYCKHLSNPA